MPPKVFAYIARDDGNIQSSDQIDFAEGPSVEAILNKKIEGWYLSTVSLGLRLEAKFKVAVLKGSAASDTVVIQCGPVDLEDMLDFYTYEFKEGSWKKTKDMKPSVFMNQYGTPSAFYDQDAEEEGVIDLTTVEEEIYWDTAPILYNFRNIFADREDLTDPIE